MPNEWWLARCYPVPSLEGSYPGKWTSTYSPHKSNNGYGDKIDCLRQNGERMPDDIAIAQPISIREAGFDEYWLQGQIFDNPGCLHLGDVEAIAKERQQASGGRLDILLKNPEDDTMYEVEVMLGETDETHIVRTIEYWDNEKRKFPQRQHFAVLVAEHINRRFFNVIHLLSHSIPIIAIHVALLQFGGKRILSFTKVLDTYEEVDDGTSMDEKTYNRDYWIKRAKSTLEAAEALVVATTEAFVNPVLNYVKHYVAITVGGNNYMWLHKRSQNKSLLGFRMVQSLQEDAASLLDAQNITYVRKPKRFLVTVDRELIEKNATVFSEIAKLVKKSWEIGG